jgi:hypothetical protein
VQQGIQAFQKEWCRYRLALAGSLAPLWMTPRDRLRATIVRSVVAPTPDEAALFGAWLHDENFGSDRVEPIAGGLSAQALPWLDPRTLVEIPMTELYWPFGLAALSDEHLGRAAALAAGGLIDWKAFSSDLETGPFEIYADLGWGFADAGKLGLKVRRNRRGLSLARATIRGDFVQRVRLDPAKRPCLIRLDWIRLRCRLHGRTEPVVIELSDPADFAGLKFNGCRLVAPKVLIAPGEDPWFSIDVQERAGGRVYEVGLECAFALLPLARSAELERRPRAKAALMRVAKESRFFGAPLRFARRVATRLMR